MVAKKIFVGLACSSILLAFGFFYISNKKRIPDPVQDKINTITPQKAILKQETNTKKQDLYNENLYDIPLYSIAEISKLSPSIKNTVDKLLESSLGFYFLKVVDENVFIILKNPITQSDTYPRHDLQFVKIDAKGKPTYHNAGFGGIEGELLSSHEKNENEIWIFDKDLENYPQKHISYDENGNIKYTEIWNYEKDINSNELIKYEMKDAKNNIISILKEIYPDNNHYRKEHIFYDNKGNVLMSLSVNYEGANINRMTFFNSHELVDSVSILTEFEKGLKTKELIYNEDYDLENIVVSTYQDDNRKEIKVLTSDGKEILKIN